MAAPIWACRARLAVAAAQELEWQVEMARARVAAVAAARSPPAAQALVPMAVVLDLLAAALVVTVVPAEARTVAGTVYRCLFYRSEAAVDLTRVYICGRR
ncbi:hypothetical protein, partial [Dyella sp. C11]|uniref:hypothetical protein n=1 Tax=Dyella sp. C11 TaxID=2126991 RepID=UPI001E4B5F28